MVLRLWLSRWLCIVTVLLWRRFMVVIEVSFVVVARTMSSVTF